MRNILLSLVMVAVLVAAGVGGTLASMSDTEMAIDNTFSTGSLDLLIWDSTDNAWDQDAPYGNGVSNEVNITDAIPDVEYWDIITVGNFGDGVCGDLYLHIKNVSCSNVTSSHEESRIVDDYGDESVEYKPEPEMVEERGGFLDQVAITALGWEPGDDCCMIGHTQVAIWYEGTWVLESIDTHDSAQDGWMYFGDLDDDGHRGLFGGDMAYVMLGLLPYCGTEGDVYIGIKFPQLDDDTWGCGGSPSEGHDAMFAGHPTNAYMLDRIHFTINFALVENNQGVTRVDLY